MRTPRWWAWKGSRSVLGAIVATGAMAGVAGADVLAADTDLILINGVANSEIRLDLEAGKSHSFDVDLYVRCSSKDHHMDGSVTASYDSANSTVATGGAGGAPGALGATAVKINEPAGWPADGRNCSSDKQYTSPARSTVTVTAPTGVTGEKTYVLRWKTDDPHVQAGNAGGGTSNLTIKVNVKAPPAPTPPADTTPPVITKVVSGTLGQNGWYTNAPTVTWSVSDPESAFTIVSGCGSDSFTQSTSSATSSCKATSAGGTSTESVSLKVDVDSPVVVPADVNDTTWRNSSLSQAFTASDAMSGLANNADGSFTLTASAESTKDTAGVVPTSVSKTVLDQAGNSTTRSVSALIDLTDPVIVDKGPSAAANGANGWYTSAVSNSFEASDGLSGLPSTFANPFSKSSGTREGDAITINSGSVTDIAGNTRAGIDSASFKIDLSDPLIGVTDNNSATYNVCASGRPEKPRFNPSDAVSGIDLTKTSETWTPSAIASGVGTYTYSAKTADLAGRTATYGEKSYKVTYGDSTSGGAYSGILQPVNADGTSRFKIGSTVPAKFKLMCGTTPISNAVAKLTLSQNDPTPDAGVDEAVSTSAATTGNLFRYDAGSEQYIFNLSTKAGYVNPNGQTVSFSPGTWFLTITLDDGTSRSTKVQLVK